MACLLSTKLTLNPRQHIEPSGVHTCNRSIRDVDIGGSGVQGHSQLHSEFKVSLGYMKPCIHSGADSVGCLVGRLREGKQDDVGMELKTHGEWLESHRHLSQVLPCLDFPPAL